MNVALKHPFEIPASPVDPGRACPVSAPLTRLSQKEVDLICRRHDQLWAGEPGGARAVFASCDLSGHDLRGRNLIDADFHGAILVDCRLNRTLFDRSSMTATGMNRAALQEASLRRVDLRGSVLSNANLESADLTEACIGFGTEPVQGRLRHLAASDANFADFSGADLSRAKLIGIQAYRANFTGARMHQCRLAHAVLDEACLDYADLSGADLIGTSLVRAHLDHTVLIAARTIGWITDEADIDHAIRSIPPETEPAARVALTAQVASFLDWVRSGGVNGIPHRFQGVDFRALTDLNGQDLTALVAPNACFVAMNLSSAHLAGADLRKADLRGCNLRGADLRGTRLQGACLDDADLRGARFGNLDFQTGPLISDLRGASLRRAQFDAAGLLHAHLDAALAHALVL